MNKLVLVLLLSAVPVMADTISYPYNSIPVNGTTGPVYFQNNQFTMTGTTYYGGTITADNSTLNIQSPGYFPLTVAGGLGPIFFNKKTGLFQAVFEGKITYQGTNIEKCDGPRHCTFEIRATLYENINLLNHTMSGGRLVYSTAPEPQSIALFVTGLVGIFGIGRRKILKG